MTRKRKLWIAAAAGLVLVLAGGGAVLAQTPTPTTGTTFLDRVAQKLGITTPRLQDAIKSASSDQLKAQVASGHLTQQQADRILQGLVRRVDSGAFGFAPGPGLHGEGFPHFRGMPFDLKQEGQKLADFLGIPLSQLGTELSASNATLATVAQAHGKTRDQLKTFISGEAKARLDQLVKNQDLTQTQADAALAMLNSHLDQLIDSKFLGRHWREFPEAPDMDGARPMMPGMAPMMPGTAPTTPGTTPQPQGSGIFGAFSRG